MQCVGIRWLILACIAARLLWNLMEVKPPFALAQSSVLWQEKIWWFCRGAHSPHIMPSSPVLGALPAAGVALAQLIVQHAQLFLCVADGLTISLLACSAHPSQRLKLVMLYALNPVFSALPALKSSSPVIHLMMTVVVVFAGRSFGMVICALMCVCCLGHRAYFAVVVSILFHSVAAHGCSSRTVLPPVHCLHAFWLEPRCSTPTK